MHQSRSTEIKVGLVTLVAVALLVLGILLGQGFSFTPSLHQIHIRLAHSGGLKNGSPVMVNGVERGKVSRISADQGSVLAIVDIDHLEGLHSDAFARVSMLEITGGKKVEIFPGDSSGAFDPSREMRGETASDIGDLVMLVGDMSTDLMRLMRRIDTITGAVTAVMKDSTFVNNVASIASNGAMLMSDARIWLQENRSELSATVRQAKAALDALRRLVADNEPAITSSIAKLDARLTEMEATLAKADTAIVNVDSLVKNINGVITDIRTNDGFAHAALYDTNFRRRIDTTVSRLNGFIRFARERGLNVNVGIGHQ